MRIAILMTVHNRKDITLRCLDHLHSQEIPNDYTFETYLTDDGCTDGTREIVTKRFPMVHIVDGDGTLYWNRGMYCAWKAAETGDYDFYMWLNDDTMLLDNSIEALLATSELENHKSIIVGSTTDSVGSNITYSGWNKSRLLDPRTDKVLTADHFNGNIVLIPRGVFKRLGKNDPYFHHALGDFDYGLRAKKSGVKSVVCDRICGICDGHPVVAKWKDPNIPLLKRWKALYGVGGNSANPFEYFHYKKRHSGWFKACLIFISNHIHVLFPKLWKNEQ